jgi:hypothetical protein
MLSVNYAVTNKPSMLSVNMLNVVKLNVVAPSGDRNKHYSLFCPFESYKEKNSF